jgi:hypothetical protein
MSDTYIPRGAGKRQTASSIWFNLDNGSGTTIDDVILRHSQAISIKAARVVYVDATTGTVAAAHVKLGTTVGGTDLVAQTAYENSKAVGVATALTLKAAASFVAAGTPICVRHTGVASTAAGQSRVFIEFEVLP